MKYFSVIIISFVLLLGCSHSKGDGKKDNTIAKNNSSAANNNKKIQKKSGELCDGESCPGVVE